jgi:hypothetical protein
MEQADWELNPGPLNLKTGALITDLPGHQQSDRYCLYCNILFNAMLQIRMQYKQGL